jgi:hypothetical protein
LGDFDPFSPRILAILLKTKFHLSLIIFIESLCLLLQDHKIGPFSVKANLLSGANGTCRGKQTLHLFLK